MQNLTVCKSNKVIEAGYRLSLNEQKIVLICIARHNPLNPLSASDRFDVSAREFSEITGIEVSHAYESLKDVADSLFNRYIIIDNPDKSQPKLRQIKTRWISSIGYMPDSGTISLRFAADMLPYLSELQSCFTKYELKNIGGMTSVYGVRLYELLSQYRTFGRREFTIAWLKSHFEIADAYKSITDFRKYVINQAVNNINTHSDMAVQQPIYVKTGRSVTGIVFDFKTRPKAPPVRAKKKAAAQPTAMLSNLEHFAGLRKRFGDNAAIPPEIETQLKELGRW